MYALPLITDFSLLTTSYYLLSHLPTAYLPTALSVP
jgi:hypothetical protein